jgi:hypothetical protein
MLVAHLPNQQALGGLPRNNRRTGVSTLDQICWNSSSSLPCEIPDGKESSFLQAPGALLFRRTSAGQHKDQAKPATQVGLAQHPRELSLIMSMSTIMSTLLTFDARSYILGI